MPDSDTAEPIWTPDPDRVADAAITRFAAEVSARTGHDVGSYADLWAWSVEHLEQFWAAVWDFFDIAADGTPHAVLADATMPGARWFPGTRLNYAEHALRSGTEPGRADAVAVTAIDEDGATTTTTWAELRAQVAAFAGWLRETGVRPGDRVVGYLPNTTPTLVAFLASASIGAVWSACGQDYSAQGAAARFAQLEPVVLVAADGYRWNGRVVDRRGEVAALARALPTLRATVRVPHPGLRATAPDPGRRGRRSLAGRHGHPRRAPVRAGAVRRAAVGAVLLGHDRAAEGHRARPRRGAARALQAARPAHGPGPGPAAVLVHDHQLDDVEHGRLRPAGRSAGRALRRQPGPPRSAAPVADRRRPRRGGARAQPRLPARQREGGPGTGPRPGSEQPARHRLDRRPAAGGVLSVGARPRGAGGPARRRPAAAPTSSAPSPAARPPPPSGPARSPRRTSASRWRPGTPTAGR